MHHVVFLIEVPLAQRCNAPSHFCTKTSLKVRYPLPSRGLLHKRGVLRAGARGSVCLLCPQPQVLLATMESLYGLHVNSYSRCPASVAVSTPWERFASLRPAAG